MKEIGEITAIEGEFAVIKIQRSSYCNSCGACKLADQGDEMILTVPNSLAGQPGDLVELGLKSTSILKASVIIYLIPLISLIVGVVCGYAIAGKLGGNPELYGALTGVSFTILTFVGINILDPVFRKKGNYSPQIISIINKSAEGEK